ncbi:MAG: DUF3089 domain-containing protein [Saprospiraceae bacterium]
MLTSMMPKSTRQPMKARSGTRHPFLITRRGYLLPVTGRHIIDFFFTKDTASARKAYDLAYEDIYGAFLHYYDNWNNGRPIIIAGHSQGALMAIRLLKEVFDNKEMKNKLVVAYVVGFPVPEGTFKYLQVCHETFADYSCICSWRTFKSGTEPRHLKKEEHRVLIAIL